MADSVSGSSYSSSAGGVAPSSSAAGQSLRSLTLLQRARFALFDGFIAVSHNASMSRAGFLILEVLGLLQLLILPLSPGLLWRAGTNPVTAFQGFLLAVAFSPWTDASGTLQCYSRTSMFTAASVYAGTTLGLFWQYMSSALGHKEGRLRVQLLRVLLQVGTTAGLVPLVTNLLSPLTCDVTGHWDGLPCWLGAHLAAVAVGLLLLLPLLALLAAAALLLKSPTLDLKDNPTLQSHGRCQAARLLVVAGMAAFFVLGGTPGAVSNWALVLVDTAGGLALVALQLACLEYYDQSLNRAMAALQALFLTAALSALMSVGLASSGMGGTTSAAVYAAALAWALLSPLAAQAGWFAAMLRWRAVGRSKDLSSPYIFEMRVRHLLTEGASVGGGWLQSSSEAGNNAATAAAAAAAAAAAPPTLVRGAAALYGSMSHHGGGGGGGGSSDAVCPVVGPVGKFGGGKGGRGGRERARIDPSVLRIMDMLLVEATAALSGNAQLHQFQAVLARGVRHNLHLERMHLRAASANAEEGALDIHFFVAQRLAVLKEEEARSSGGKMTVELRLHFEALQAAAEAKVLRCWMLILSFWQALSEVHPDYGSVRATGAQVQVAIQEAERLFRDLLAMAPTSVQVLRAYAAFCLEISNAPGLAADMLADAEALEEEASKALAGATDVDVVFGAPSEIDMTAEGVALIRVSARSSEVGVGAIIHANTAALKIFGFSDSKREVLGRELSMILPEPIATVHHHFLSQFYMDGIQVITGAPKMLFTQHRSGHLVPVRAHVYSSGEVWACAMEEIHNASSLFLWVYGVPGYPVTAACRGALGLLGFTPTAMRSGSVVLGTYIADVPGVLRAVVASGNAGCVVAMRSHGQQHAGRSAADAGKPPPQQQQHHHHHHAPPPIFMLIKAQSLNVIHLQAPLYIVRMRRSSPADVAAAAASGHLLGLLPGERAPGMEDWGVAAAAAAGAPDWGAAPAAAALMDGGAGEQEGSEEGSIGDSLSVENSDGEGSVDERAPVLTSEPGASVPTSEPAATEDAPAAAAAPADVHADAPSAAAVPAATQQPALEPLQAPQQPALENLQEPLQPALEPLQALQQPALEPLQAPQQPTLEPLQAPQQPALEPQDAEPLPQPPLAPPPPGLALEDTQAGTLQGLLLGLSGGAPSGAPIGAAAAVAAEAAAEAAAEPAPPPGASAAVIAGSMPAPLAAAAAAAIALPAPVTALAAPPIALQGLPSPQPPPSQQLHTLRQRGALKRATVQWVEGGGPGHTEGEGSGGSAPGPSTPAKGRKVVEKTPHPTSAALRAPGAAGSVSSSGSRGVRLSAAEMVRRGVAARASRMEGSLVRLRNSVIVTFIIAAIISILAYVVTRLSFDGLLTNLLAVNKAAARAVLVQQGVEQVQVEVLSNTLPGYPFESLIGTVWSKERIRTSVEEVETLHNGLYLAAESAGGSSKESYLLPTLQVHDLVPGTYQSRDAALTQLRNISLSNLVLEYIAKQRQVWWYPLAGMQPSDPTVFWLENNGPGVLADALNASMFLASQASEGTTAAVALSNLVVLLVALLVFALVALAVIMPSIGAVTQEQHEVFDVLADVPLRSIRALRDAAADKLTALKRAEEGEDQAALDVAGYGEEGGEGEGGSAATATSSSAAEGAPLLYPSRSGLAESGGGRGCCQRLLCCCCGRAPSATVAAEGSSASASSRVAPHQAAHPHHHQRRRRTYRRNSSGVLKLMLNLLWPVVLFCLYFVLMYLWRDSVNKTALYFRTEVLWGAELQLLVPSLAYSLRNALAYNASAAWVPYWVNRTASQLALAASLVDQLTYGSTPLSLRAALTSSPTAQGLLMQNGCVDNGVSAAACANYGGRGCHYFYSYASCWEPPTNVDPTYPVFFYGLVGKGLLPALQQYLLLTVGLLGDRRAALAAQAGAGASAAPLPLPPLTAAPQSQVDQLGRLYLPAGLQALAAGRLAEDSAYLASFSSLNLTATLCSVVALLGFYLALYRPLFSALDKDIKTARSLLLLLPEDTARSVPSVLDAGKRLMTSQ